MEDPLLGTIDYEVDRSRISPSERKEKAWHFVPEDLLSPVLGTTVLLPFAVAFVGVIVSANPSLAPHTPTLLSTVILSQGLGSLSFSVFSTYCTCTNVDLLSAAFLANFGMLLRQRAKAAEEAFGEIKLTGEALLVHILFAQGLFAILVGGLLCVIAAVNGIWFMRYLPYPVACGFVSGIGLLVLDGGFELGCSYGMKELISSWGSLPMTTYAHAAATILVGFFFLGMHRVIRNAARLPVCLVLVTMVVHGGAAALGLGEAGLEQHGMFLHGLSAESWTTSWAKIAEGYQSVQMSAFFNEPCITLTISYALLHLLAYPFYAQGMQDIDPPPGKLNLKREIYQLGLTNVFLGLLAGVPSAHSYKVCVLMKETGAKTRLWVVLLGLTFMALYFDTAIRPGIALVPKCAFGGLVFSLGVNFISSSLLESRKRVAPMEWNAVLLTALLTYFNVLIGLVFGCLLTMGLFVVEYSGITGIVSQASLVEVRSLVKRPKEDAHILHLHGQDVSVFWCTGYIFFGTAASIVEEIESHLDSSFGSRCIIIDFEQVPAVDASGVHALTEFAGRCSSRDPPVQVCFCGLVRRLRLAINNVVSLKSISVSPRLDSGRLEGALQWAEEMVLKRAKASSLKLSLSPPPNLGASPEMDAVSTDSLEAALRQMLSEIAPRLQPGDLLGVAARLAPHSWVETYVVGPGKLGQGNGLIFTEGSPAANLIYLISGTAELTRRVEADQMLKLPRHHLNSEKGDHFAFEERTDVRVQLVERGSILGAIELGFADGASSNGTLTSAAVPQRLTSAAAAPRCQALLVPYRDLHEAFKSNPIVGYEVMAWLSKLASAQVMEQMKISSTRPYRLTAIDEPTFCQAVSMGEEV
mmetsp:Transcript_5001/g.12184  ORF Transcript_5001/g.12184 Transcript_5001/m.12184 type:complete len:866 (-) Transcript_5001:98-2695(-)